MAGEREMCIVSVLLLFLVLPFVSSNCGPIDHDIRVLREQSYWYFETDAFSDCTPFKPQDINVTSTCIFYFSICHPVPVYCPGVSGICFANRVTFSPKDNNTHLYSTFLSIGGYSEKFISEADDFTLELKLVEDIFSQPIPVIFNSHLKFKCVHGASWNRSSDGKVPFKPGVSFDPDLSLYTFTFNYSGACKGGSRGGGDEGPTSALSVGSILLILFFPGIFLYCVVGALINKGAGKTGKDMMPNAKFWSDLPGLIADGFSFVLAKITCSAMSTSRQSYDQM
ncbi:uncharacterized protein [Montipora foliosa]|uniref:uncharacterized protein n=1 Tax=Montipora foliosa TaxID=591990 RepID=UPI0035F154D4